MNTTKYGTLFDTLKSEILSGKYHSNFPFPSVRALIGRFKLSDRTVRHALDELYAQGLISRKQGRGTFVSGNVASRTIGLIMPDVTQSEYFVRIFRELMRVAESRQYKLLFGEIQGATAKDRAACAERLVNDFIVQRVSGVIFQPIEYYADGDDFNRRMLSRLTNARIPVVLCDNGVALNLNGTRQCEIPVTLADGRLSFALDTSKQEFGTPYFEVEFRDGMSLNRKRT